MSFTLYQPEKYPVITGDHPGIGLATCWTDPVGLLKQHPEIQKYAGLTGTLYSREGVSIILRNLCLNPTIRTLYVWGNAPLSNTQFGVAGRTLLNQFWQHGLDVNGVVGGSSSKLHAELDATVLNVVRKHVTLHDISEYPTEKLVQELEKAATKPAEKAYMKSVAFPETKRSTDQPAPSEEIGWAVRHQKLPLAWATVLDRILRYGTVKGTEYGNSQKELQVITWVIEQEDLDHFELPDWPAELVKAVGMHEEMLAEYAHAFLDAKLPEGTVYTYGSRLRDYTGGLDQIDEIIKHLRKSPITRRAFGTTLNPPVDITHHSPPCLCLIQFLTDGQGKLNCIATFRSHDIFKAALPNAYALLHLQRYVAESANMAIGKLAITSHSAHIYEEDWENALKLVECAIRGRVKPVFDEQYEVDPRGIVRIQVDGKNIMARLMSLNGDEIIEEIGTSARQIALCLAKKDLLLRPDHYVDITIELLKAELALKNNLPYVQDKPLYIHDLIIK